MSGLRGTLDPLDQMDRRAAGFIDGGEVGLDDMGDDVSRMNADSHPYRRIAQELDTANQFDRGVTRQNRMVIVGMGGAKKRDKPVATFLTDDSPVAANRSSHGNQRRLQSRNCGLGVQFGDQIS
ncbi:MAG: hypothetical protein P4M05_07575 [Bradyrhizobium sp.]|nr:hypothetical protein [Bradyrhizobium sp.]